MKSQIIRKILFGLVMTAFWFSGRSSESPDSLSHYMGIAIKKNPQVLQRYAEYEAAVRKIPQAGSLPDPELSTGIFLSPMELLSGKQVADIRLMQMFPWFGTLKSAKDEMTLMAKAKYETFRDAQLQVMLEVQRTWYEMAKVNTGLKISQKNMELLQTIERLTIARFSAGSSGSVSPSGSMAAASGVSSEAASGSGNMNNMGGGQGNQANQLSEQAGQQMTGNSMSSQAAGTGLSDVYRIQMEINELANNIELQKNRLETISARFNSLLNRSLSASIAMPDTIVSVDFNPAVPTIPDSILGTNPMLGMLKFEEKSLEARKEMISKMGYPMLGFGLNYSVIGKNEMSSSTMNGKDMIMPMVTATLPVYRKKYKAMREEADYLKTASQMNYQATANSLQTEYYEALQLYRDSRLRYQLYSSQCQLASKSLEVMLRSFGASGTSLTDILRIRQQTFDFENKQIEAVADLYTSVAWIKRLMAKTEIQYQEILSR